MIDTTVFEDPARFDAAFETMPPSRQEKILKYRYPKDRWLSLGAGVLLEEAIKDAGLTEDAKAPRPKILEGPKGKPYLEGVEDRFQFSLSHSEYLACCVYASDPAGHAMSVGCDVEKIKTANFDIAERYFSPEENAFLKTLTGEEKNTAFYRIWTLKESILKADGRGLNIPLNSFTIRFSADGKAATDFGSTDVKNGAADAKNIEKTRKVSLYEEEIPGYRIAWCTIEAL